MAVIDRLFAKRTRQRAGWLAVALSTIVTSFWAFWGIVENFHEGWYLTSLPANVGLMLVQYLSPMFIFLALALISIHWPRVGAGLHVVLALFAAAFFQALTHTVTLLLILPLVLLGALHALGRPRPRRLAILVTVGLPLVTLIVSGVGPALRVAQRLDDGNRGARSVSENGVDLIWAPSGPGWPRTAASWHEAQQRCAYLQEDGLSAGPGAQQVWRLPTVDEAVRSMARHGRNSGGNWDEVAGVATYRTTPDKESPLWDTFSPVIYWWMATEVDEERAYIIVYDGRVWSRDKNLKLTYLAFRCVKGSNTEQP